MFENYVTQTPSRNQSADNFPLELDLDDFFQKYECYVDDNSDYSAIINELRGILERNPGILTKRNSEGDLPIHTACKAWLASELLEFIVNANTDMVKEKDQDGLYPLSLAISISEEATEFTYTTVIETMIRIYPDAVYSRDESGHSLLHQLIKEVGTSSPRSDNVKVLVEAAPEMVSIPCSDGKYLLVKACDWMLSDCEVFEFRGYSFFSMPQSDRLDSWYNLQHFLKHSHTDIIIKAMEHLLNEIAIKVEHYDQSFLHVLISHALQAIIQTKTSRMSPIKNYTGNPSVDRATLMIDAFHSENGLPNLTLHAAKVMFGKNWPDVKIMAAVRDEHNNYPLHYALRRIQKTNQLRDFIAIIKYIIVLNPKAVLCKDHEGYYPLHLCLKFGASLDLVQLLYRVYPAAISFLNHDMDDSGFNLDIVGTYDISLDIIFYLMQQDINCIVGRFKKETHRFKCKKQKTSHV